MSSRASYGRRGGMEGELTGTTFPLCGREELWCLCHSLPACRRSHQMFEVAGGSTPASAHCQRRVSSHRQHCMVDLPHPQVLSNQYRIHSLQCLLAQNHRFRWRTRSLLYETGGPWLEGLRIVVEGMNPSRRTPKAKCTIQLKKNRVSK